MTLIAFHGRLGSGKDTAGERMAAMVDVPTYRVSFARPLKESAAALLDIPVEDWETYKNDPDVKILLTVGWTSFDMGEYVNGEPSKQMCDEPNVVREFTAREFLQRYGTESHRGIFGDSFWVDHALANYSFDQPGLTYITDCRFVNEAQAVLDSGGVVVRVIGANEDTGTHASETPLPDSVISFEIDNTVRGDDFVNLDSGLKSLAGVLGIPLKKESLV